MNDPTYIKAEINSNPVWKIAWVLAQCKDDGAPIGWSKWIWVAEEIIKAQNEN